MIQLLDPTLHILKTALASGLSYQLAFFVSQNHYPYFAPLAVILTLQTTVAATLQKAIFRMAGIFGGVVISLVVGYWLHTGALSITLIVLLGMAISELFGLNPQIKAQVCITALLVLISKDSKHYAVDRLYETLLGCVIALGINYLIPPQEDEADGKTR